ncbi:hypothetical protein CYY_008252 [Polysphondylium violaceum]|uniref:Arf-GAP domain-containing protein n=1 Tax=Polysphondylium violaceum TaxID=133409 RepID=A0A8J4V451_9MYCE|nr:hypothetical protein CYY_008252 [Polysphondylium violaceum]
MSDRNERLVRELQKLPENLKCMDCPIGSVYVVLDLATFVCQSCSGIHSNFGRRVKSVSMGTFKPEEIAKLKTGGNKVARQYWLARWKPSDFPEPEEGDTNRIRQFIDLKYNKKQWIDNGVPKVEPLSNILGADIPPIKIFPKDQQQQNYQQQGYQQQQQQQQQKQNSFWDSPPAQHRSNPSPPTSFSQPPQSQQQQNRKSALLDLNDVFSSPTTTNSNPYQSQPNYSQSQQPMYQQQNYSQQQQPMYQQQQQFYQQPQQQQQPNTFWNTQPQQQNQWNPQSNPQQQQQQFNAVSNAFGGQGNNFNSGVPSPTSFSNTPQSYGNSSSISNNNSNNNNGYPSTTSSGNQYGSSNQLFGEFWSSPSSQPPFPASQQNQYQSNTQSNPFNSGSLTPQPQPQPQPPKESPFASLSPFSTSSNGAANNNHTNGNGSGSVTKSNPFETTFNTTSPNTSNPFDSSKTSSQNNPFASFGTTTSGSHQYNGNNNNTMSGNGFNNNNQNVYSNNGKGNDDFFSSFQQPNNTGSLNQPMKPNYNINQQQQFPFNDFTQTTSQNNNYNNNNNNNNNNNQFSSFF